MSTIDSLATVPLMQVDAAQIVTSYGRSYIVQTQDKQRLECSTRGKKTEYACGDWVKITPINAQQGVIESLLPRRTLLYRSDKMRSKLIAANVDVMLVVCAGVPAFHEEFLQRCVCAADAAQIEVVLVLNKMDLPESQALRPLLLAYQTLGYTVLTLTGLKDPTPLRPYLEGKTSILVGQSGMGKSTIINSFLPEVRARTAGISTALDSGKHTTTHAQLYTLDEKTHLIDSPGMQGFGLHHIPKTDLAWIFPEFRPFLGQCKFSNCLHWKEPGCAIHAAVQAEKVQPKRWEFYTRLLAQAS